ncbi:MAG: translation initiation factor [Staphylococcus sp.]|nr:translation initiation factor [Staphylococcus sp.]
MDWKDILSQKVNDGELEREEFIPQEPTAPKKTDVIEVCIDRKGRKGKTATLAVGFSCSDDELKDIASKLKSKLSTGGSARGGEILIQGERVADVKRILIELGFKVK